MSKPVGPFVSGPTRSACAKHAFIFFPLGKFKGSHVILDTCKVELTFARIAVFAVSLSPLQQHPAFFLPTIP